MSLTWATTLDADVTATLTYVSQVDESVGLTADERKPFLYGPQGARAGQTGDMLRIEVSGTGTAVIHAELLDPMQLFGREDLLLHLLNDDVTSGYANTALGVRIYPNYSDRTKYWERDWRTLLQRPSGAWVAAMEPFHAYGSGLYSYSRVAGTPTPLNVRGVGLRISVSGTTTVLYVSGLWGVRNRLTNGKVLFDFDDALQSQYTSIFPLFTAAGYRGNVGANGNMVNAGLFTKTGTGSDVATCTIAQLQEMQAAGWDIVSHGWDHLDLSSASYTDTEISDEVTLNAAWLDTNGFSSRFYVHPYNKPSPRGLRTIQGVCDMARGADNVVIGTTAPVMRRWNVPTTIYPNTAPDITWFRERYERARDGKLIMPLNLHGVGEGWGPITAALLEQALAEVATYGLDVITWSDLWGQNAHQGF